MRYAVADERIAAGGRPVVLVTLYAPGRTFRAASEPVEVPATDADGPYFYDARLTRAITFSPEADPLGVEAQTILTSTSVEMVLDEDVDPRVSEMAGAWLAASRCEIALIWPGQDWRDRRVILPRGTVSGMELGRAGEPIRFTAEAVLQRRADTVCDPTRDMGDFYPSSSSFGDYDGKLWPVVIGRCYGIPAFKLGDIESGAGVTYAIGIAGHTFATTTVSAAGIVVYQDGAAYTPVGTLSGVNSTDSDGGAVFWVQSTSNSDFDAAWPAATVDCVAGGVSAVRGQGAALNGDGVVAWLLAQTGATVDWARCEAALEHLRGWDIGVYVDGAPDALAILRDRVLRWLPLLEVQGTNGIAVDYLDPFRGTPERDLVVGPHLIDRIGNLTQLSDPDDVINEVTMEYAYDHYRGEYTRRITIGAAENARAKHSQQAPQYGVRAKSLSCNIVWDSATAARIAHWMIDRLALPRWGHRYLYEPDLYDLRENQLVRLTDDDMGVSGRRAVLRRVSPQLSPPECLIEILPRLGGGMED